jgi:hypothetical protein
MGSLAPEQLLATQKASFDTWFGLTLKAFEGFEKLVELNLQIVKSTLAENQEVAGKALSSKDRQGLFAQQTPPTAENCSRTLALLKTQWVMLLSGHAC